MRIPLLYRLPDEICFLSLRLDYLSGSLVEGMENYECVSTNEAFMENLKSIYQPFRKVTPEQIEKLKNISDSKLEIYWDGGDFDYALVLPKK